MNCPTFEILRKYALDRGRDGDLSPRELTQVTSHLVQDRCQTCNMRLRYIVANPEATKPPAVEEDESKEEESIVEGNIDGKHVVVGDVVPAKPVPVTSVE